jgi:hypothetical protein
MIFGDWKGSVVWKVLRLWKGLDVVRDARAVGEERAGDEGVRFSAEGEQAVSLGDEFDAEEVEIGAVDTVVGRAVFGAAADDGEGFGGSGRHVEKEALCVGDLGGEEIRFGGGGE